MKPPFPYYGSKARWAEPIWSRLGQVDVYIEPFAGSLAVLLANPHPARREVVCDADGMVCNFWRALSADPEQVARHADYPTIHQDLTARHKWLKRWTVEHAQRLTEDPEYFDAKAAGWWVWGISLWIGAGWCVGEEGFSGEGLDARGRQPAISATMGARGVARQRVSLAGDQSADGSRLKPFFDALAARLADVVVLNRDWVSAVTPTVLADTATSSGFVRGIFLDPPYRTDRRDSHALYNSDATGDSDDAAQRAYQWAIGNGDRYRVVYASHEGDFEVPGGWEKLTGSFRAHKAGHAGTRDCLMFSPACLQQQGLF